MTSLRYYGELLDPELANLHIFTAGLSPRFARRTTLDLVFHNCRQDVPSRKEFWTDLRARPTGVDRDVGWETDLILEWRRFSTWDLEVVAAYFRPGSAFSRTEVALVARLKLSYPF